MDNFSHLDNGERLVAKQAVLTLRAFKQALRTAPPDQRLEALDRAVRRHGQEHLRVMMASAVAAQRPAHTPFSTDDLDLAAAIPGFADHARKDHRMADDP